MKKLLLTLCLFLAASVGQSYAANTPNAASKQATANDNIIGNDLKGNKRFTVQVSTGEGGQIEIMGTGAISNNSVASATINTGEDVQLLITPQSGYALKTFYVDGANVLSNVGTDGRYTIQAISKNISVSATFEKSSLQGDVNNDGRVDGTDVITIYNFVQVGTESGITSEVADINGDSKVDGSDVVAVYNIIAGIE